MEFDPPTTRFDVVCLSLVLNFEGDISKRGMQSIARAIACIDALTGQMILRAHDFLTPTGLLYIVLPLSCVNNSRYLTADRLRAMLASCGFEKVVAQHDSPKLTYWLVQRTRESGWDGTTWRKEEVRAGVKRNNFCIQVKWLEEEPEEQ